MKINLIILWIQWIREFDVPSLHFPGQVHKWRLSQLLQKGTLRAHDSFLSDLALAARFLVITAKGRVCSHFLSIANALQAILQALIKLIDMLVGVPALLAHNLDYKICEERCRFLIAELICRVRFQISSSTLYSIFINNFHKLFFFF